MALTPNPNDPVVTLGITAEGLLQQYENNTITLQQLKDSVNTQIIPTNSGFNSSNFNDSNDEAAHVIAVVIRMVGSPE